MKKTLKVLAALGITIGVAWLGISYCAAQEEQPEGDETVYFAPSQAKRVTARLVVESVVYLERNFLDPIGKLPAYQVVQIIAYNRRGWLIVTQGRTPPVQGWIKPDRLPPIDPQLIEQARGIAFVEEAKKQAIEEHRVLEGMNFAEVVQAWGDPNRKIVRSYKRYKVDVWVYRTYTEQQRFYVGSTVISPPIYETYFRQVPAKERAVTFKNGRVIEVAIYKFGRGNVLTTPKVVSPFPPSELPEP